MATNLALPALPAGVTAATATVVGTGTPPTVTAIAAGAPANFTPPAGATNVYNATFTEGASGYSGQSGTFSATLAAAPAAGSSCFVGLSINGATQYLIAPAVVNGATVSYTGGAFTLPANSTGNVVFYCTPPGTNPGTTPTATPVPGSTPVGLPANTAVTFGAGQLGLPANSAVNVTTSGGTVNVVPFSTTAPTTAPSGTTGQVFIGQFTLQNPGSTAVTTTAASTLQLGTTGINNGSTCTLYSSVNGAAASSTGLTAVDNGASVTFTVPSGTPLPANSVVAFYTYCANATPAGLASPAPITNGSGTTSGTGTYQAPPATSASGNGAKASGNLTLTVPAGTTAAAAVTAGTQTATALATPPPNSLVTLGLPAYVSGTTSNSAFGGTPISYGSFVFNGGTVAGNPGGGSSNIFPTIPGLTSYATANQGTNYFLAVYNPATSQYITTSAITASKGTTPNGTPTGTVNNTDNVNFQTNASQTFTPGTVYGYVIIAK